MTTQPVAPAAPQVSITERLAGQPAERQLVHLDDELRPRRLTLGELRARADIVARALRHRYGIGPGDRVCLHARTSLDAITAIFGIWRAGAAVTVLPAARRNDPTDLQAALNRRVLAAQAALVITDALTAAGLAQLPVPVADFASISSDRPARLPPPPGPEQVALLQFTSGTTALPRAVAVRHGQLIANTHASFSSAELAPDARFVLWLPLYHDMGIITLAGAIAHGYGAHVMDTQTFSLRPAAWMEAIGTYQAAATAAPNFAYGLAGYLLSTGHSRPDLSSLRVAWNGAESIDPVALGSFTDTAAAFGMPRTSICPSYGLAEATLSVTLGRNDEHYRTLTVDRAALEQGTVREVPSGRALVDCGTPIQDTTVTITDVDGTPVPDGEVGSIRVQGPCVVDRYWTPAGSPAQASITDDYQRLVTGDLGFSLDGRLYVCGRQKDMIIVGGRNLYPEDFEFTAERVRGVRPGAVMAFSIPGSEHMVVVAETTLRDAAARDLVRAVRDAVTAELAYTPHDVVLVAPGTLPKTTSGKRQRQLCRQQYSNDALAVRASALSSR
ncbi:MAG: AMP-binding protein [Jatrophihabitantaceae bacterium]